MATGKLVLLVFLLVTLAVPALAAAEITGQSVISAVTVYPDRALVTRRVEVQVPAGDAVIVLPGLPAGLDVNTAQLRGSGLGGLTLASLEFKRTPVAEVPDEKVAQLKARIQQLEDEQQALLTQQKNIELELEMLRSLMNWQATQMREGLQTRALSVTEIEQATALLRQKIDRNRAEALEVTIQLREQGEKLNLARRELQLLAHPQEQVKLLARIPVHAERAGRAVIELTYLINGAQWGAAYDIRAVTETRKINLRYDAIITQHTGEDWSEAEITLSTASPALGAAVDDPAPVELRRYVPAPPLTPSFVLYDRADAPGEEGEVAELGGAMTSWAADADDGTAGKPVQLMTAAVGTGTSVTYRVAGKVNVPSDNQEHRFAIGESQLDGTWSYRAVPRHREYGYLRSELQYNGQMVFLPGAAAIFQDDNFVGSVLMEAIAPGDTLALQFGPDRRVSVAREDVRQQREENGFGRRQSITYRSTLVVRNNRAQAVKVTLLDRVPVSDDEDITVEIDDDNPLPAERQADGIVAWHLELAPGETRKIPFAYKVSWPEDLRVQGLE